MNADLRARIASAADALAKTARTVGIPRAVQGAHVHGPSRGRSVVVLDVDVEGLLREILEASAAPEARVDADIADAFGLRGLPGVTVPVTTAAPSTRRFRGLLDEQG